MAKPSSILSSAIFSRILLRKSRIETPPLIGSVGSMSGFLSMPWSLALSAVRMKLATLRPGIAVGYWKARNSPRRARLSGRQREDVAALPGDLAALDDVGRVAHQRVGERRLAGAVGAHDRVDLALADGQVDALEDLVVGRATGATRRPRMTRCWSVVGWSVTRGSRLRAAWLRGRWCGMSRRSGTRSARVIESSAPVMASRTRTQSRLTVQRELRSQVVACSGSSGGADHRRDRALEGAQDLAHRDRLGGAGELVAAVGAAGADDEAGLAQAHDELLEVGPREVLLGGDLGQAGRARSRSAGRAGPSAGRRTRPSC